MDPSDPSNKGHPDACAENRALRLRALRLWDVCGRVQPAATLHMKNQTSVQGRVVGCDGKQRQFVVEGLETPLGVYDHAIIRMQDVSVLSFDLDEQQLLQLYGKE